MFYDMWCEGPTSIKLIRRSSSKLRPPLLLLVVPLAVALDAAAGICFKLLRQVRTNLGAGGGSAGT